MKAPGINTTSCISNRYCNLAALVLALLISTTLPAQRASEYQVKAAFIYNFTKFVEWPPEVLGSESEPFVITVIGNNPFGTYLLETVSGEKAFGRPMIVRHVTNIQEAASCHIVFVNSPGLIEQVLDLYKGKPVITVSDAEDFCNKGGTIQFYSENETIRLEISPESARSSKLEISSKLLRIAKIHR